MSNKMTQHELPMPPELIKLLEDAKKWTKEKKKTPEGRSDLEAMYREQRKSHARSILSDGIRTSEQVEAILDKVVDQDDHARAAFFRFLLDRENSLDDAKNREAAYVAAHAKFDVRGAKDRFRKLLQETILQECKNQLRGKVAINGTFVIRECVPLTDAEIYVKGSLDIAQLVTILMTKIQGTPT